MSTTFRFEQISDSHELEDPLAFPMIVDATVDLEEFKHDPHTIVRPLGEVALLGAEQASHHVTIDVTDLTANPNN
ncbi:MAG TPA: hypothetical protein VLF39_03840 [Candidatus Saccharimonadales bacterium]|nr:hypothetical protein [Candidatus Saccharimonadales bacterium]